MAIIPSDEKVIMVSSTANTTYSGSKSLKEMAEWYTMEDVTSTVRPYKVYTALLTQSGASVPAKINGGVLTVGVTYEIIFNTVGMDFTNVGAPNNNVGTFFVATGTTPNNWGVGPKNKLSYNTGAPVATVLENTIGNIWFTYESIGNYTIKKTADWDDEKTWYGFGGSGNTGVFDVYPGNQIASIEGSTLFLITLNDDFSTPLNNQLNKTPIEIRVYN
jgi:hypothetical protein